MQITCPHCQTLCSIPTATVVNMPRPNFSFPCGSCGEIIGVELAERGTTIVKRSERREMPWTRKVDRELIASLESERLKGIKRVITSPTRAELEAALRLAEQREDYEQCAIYRDQLRALDPPARIL